MHSKICEPEGLSVMNMKIIFAGGGTAGHINPALAIAKYVRTKQPNAQILFIGTEKGMESHLVPKEGFEIKFIDVLGLKRKFSLENIKAVAKAINSYRQSLSIIRSFKPDIVIGTGGYVSGPVLAAAAVLKIPTLIHEQNVSPGMTSKILSNFVDIVCISFKESSDKFKKAKKIIHTGNPLRPELFETKKPQARAALSLDERPFIVVFGGSLGAQKINDAMISFINNSKEKNNFQLLFATGKNNYTQVLQKLEGKKIPHDIKIVEYINNMAQVMSAADLIIARAGAITISEINALGKPSILIPSPNVTDNHQEFNARTLEVAGAALLLKENELGENTLTEAITNLISDEARLIEMSKNSYKMGIKNAAEGIYNLGILSLIKQKK